MTLQKQLDQMHQKILTNAPEAAVALDADTEALVQGRIGAAGPKVGQPSPSFEIPDQLGRLVSSKELLNNGPLVVSFYRGNW